MRFFANPLNGFKYAIEGVVHVLRTQRHMRFHFLTLLMVLIVSLIFGLSRTEVMVLLFTITLVLAAEMFNTAIEAVTDLVTQTYHPLAKFAKDIAAGAVLITTLNALAIGFLLFLGGNKQRLVEEIGLHPPDLATVLVVASILVATTITMWKVAGGRGKLWRGGIVSGHAALGFFLATTILFTSKKLAVGAMAFALAALVAQSRVEGGIHTLREVVTGALVATLISSVAYYVLGPVI
ncbi:MAG: diacylglycerol kinase [Armatimonadetes bacterium]|nr:diacylglycerol kinase [Armatimonadota bacterium]